MAQLTYCVQALDSVTTPGQAGRGQEGRKYAILKGPGWTNVRLGVGTLPIALEISTNKT